MAISGSLAGPDITGIGSAIGAIADEASEVMNEFDRPNVRWVRIHKTKYSTDRVEFAFSKFDFVFYAIAAGCVKKGIDEHMAGGSFYDFVKRELSEVLNSLRSEIQKMVASAGIGGLAGMFMGGVGGGTIPGMPDSWGRRDLPPAPDPMDPDSFPPADTITQEQINDVVKFLDLEDKIIKDPTLADLCIVIKSWLGLWLYLALNNRSIEMKYAYKIAYAWGFLKKYGPSVGVTMPTGKNVNEAIDKFNLK